MNESDWRAVSKNWRLERYWAKEGQGISLPPPNSSKDSPLPFWCRRPCWISAGANQYPSKWARVSEVPFWLKDKRSERYWTREQGQKRGISLPPRCPRTQRAGGQPPPLPPWCRRPWISWKLANSVTVAGFVVIYCNGSEYGAYNCLMRDLGIHDSDKLKNYADIKQIIVI